MWATPTWVVLVTVSLVTTLACLASILLVGRLRGRTRVSVKLFGLGFTVDHSANPDSNLDEKPAADAARKGVEAGDAEQVAWWGKVRAIVSGRSSKTETP
jgi:hypothetical protein